MSRVALSVWPPLPPGAYGRPKGRPPFPLDRPGTPLYARARTALWQAVRALGLGQGDEILVPPYHHGSEIEALVRAGLSLRFYGQDEDLHPVGLDDLVGENTRALYLIHYMGFPADALLWRSWCDRHGLLLVEDAAMAWLSSREHIPTGSIGDAAIFCVYKSVGVPDGGAVVATRNVPEPDRSAPLGLRGGAARHLSWMAGRSASAAALRRVVEPRVQPFSATREFGLGDVTAPASRLTRALLPRLASGDVPERRLANYRVLLDRLGEHVPSPFADPSEGASPFVFPLRTGHKPRLLGALEDRGVIGLDLWSVPHPALPTEGFPHAAELRRSVVGLPVHQELRRRDLDAIARATASAL